MQYRLSKYSLPIQWEDCMYFFSTRSKALVKAAPSLWHALKSGCYFSENGIESNPLVKRLADSSIITTEEEDANYYDNLKIRYLKRSFQSSHLSLTILPTQACNLCCPYCFEADKKPISMTEEVQEALIKYITSQPIKTYSITWFGGEPLLRPDIIDSILKKISGIPDIRLSYHNIITNGTFLNQRVYDLFKRFPLDSLQITLDGKKDAHDRLRCDSNGVGSFEVIKRNIIDFVSEFPKTHISIRVNVNKATASDFADIYNDVMEWFKGKDVDYNVYPGIIKSVDGNVVESGCLSKIEQQEFYLDLHSKGIRFHGFPKNETGGCTATTSSSLVVGADGDLYKCWEDIGKENLKTGSILHNSQGHAEVLADYMLKGTKFAADECKDCGYLPICSGGCPKERIQHKNIKPLQCSLYSVNEGKLLKTVLKEYIERKISK